MTVKKEILQGTTADLNGEKSFNFTAKLYKPNGITPWSDYNAGGFTNGSASFALSSIDTKVLEVPLNAVVEIIEDANEAYEITGSYLSDNGVASTSTSEFTSGLTSKVRINDKNAITLTCQNKRRTVDVKVKKTVVGNGGDFTFTASLLDGTTPCENWMLYASNPNIVTGDGTNGTISGQAQFILSPTKSKPNKEIILKIPYGSEFTVSEEDLSNYQTTIANINGATISNLTITLPASLTKTGRTITFTNKEVYVAPTGYITNYKPFFMMFGFGAILVGLIVPPIIMFRRRREEEE